MKRAPSKHVVMPLYPGGNLQQSYYPGRGESVLRFYPPAKPSLAQLPSSYEEVCNHIGRRKSRSIVPCIPDGTRMCPYPCTQGVISNVTPLTNSGMDPRDARPYLGVVTCAAKPKKRPPPPQPKPQIELQPKLVDHSVSTRQYARCEDRPAFRSMIRQNCYLPTDNTKSVPAKRDDVILPVDEYTYPSAPYAIDDDPHPVDPKNEAIFHGLEKRNKNFFAPSSRPTNAIPSFTTPYVYMPRRRRPSNIPKGIGFTYNYVVGRDDLKSISAELGMNFTRKKYLPHPPSRDVLAWRNDRESGGGDQSAETRGARRSQHAQSREASRSKLSVCHEASSNQFCADPETSRSHFAESGTSRGSQGTSGSHGGSESHGTSGSHGTSESRGQQDFECPRSRRGSCPGPSPLDQVSAAVQCCPE